MIEDDGFGVEADGGEAMPAAESAPTAQPMMGTESTAWPEPNERHVARLKQDPSLADQFEMKFGPGAASRALGVGVSETARQADASIADQETEWWGKRAARDVMGAMDGAVNKVRSTLGLPELKPDTDEQKMNPLLRVAAHLAARQVYDIGETKRGVYRGIFSVEEMAGKGVEQFGKTLGSETIAGIGGRIAKQGKDISRNEFLKARVESIAKIGKESFVSDTVDYLAGKLGEGVGNMSAVAAFYAGAGVAGGLGFLATISIGEMRGELEEAGITDEKTIATYAYSAGLVMAALESVFPAHVLKELSDPAKRAISGHITRTVINGAAGGAWREGLTEGMQEAVQIAAVAHATDSASAFDTKPVLDAFARGDNAIRIVDAVIGGALPGGTFGGVTAGVTAGKGVQEARARGASGTATDASPTAETPAAPATPAPTADTRTIAPSVDGPGERAAPGEGAVRVQLDPEQDAAINRVRSLIQPRRSGQDDEQEAAPEPGPAARPEPLESEIEQELPAAAAEIEDFYRSADWDFDLDDADVRAITRNMLKGMPVDEALETYFDERHAALTKQRTGQPRADESVAQPQPADEQSAPTDDAGAASVEDRGLPELGRDSEQPDRAPTDDGDGQLGREAVAEPEVEPVTDDDRRSFAQVLAGKTQRAQWARSIGATDAQMQQLIDEAVSDGRLEMRNGAPRRTANAKTIPEALRAAPAAQSSNQRMLDAAQQSGMLQIVTVGDRKPVEVPNLLAVRPADEAKRLLSERLTSTGFKTIVEARKFAKDSGIKATGKALDELIEQAIVDTARGIVARETSPQEAYRQLVDLYDRQPNLAVRTSTSVANQAYSTPMPLAYVASRLAGVSQANAVYEPSAGNGALLIEASPTRQRIVANELEPGRASALKAQGFETTTADATDPALAQRIRAVEPAGAVIMNPPFGAVRSGGKSKAWAIDGWSTTQVDHAIALEGLKAMADDGRAVLILGGIKAKSEAELRKGYRGQAKREFYFRLYNQYNVVDHFTVSGDLYRKQGAGWPVDVIVIEGRGKSQRPLPAAQLPAMIDSWDALAEKINGVDAGAAVGQDDRAAAGIGESESRDADAIGDAGRGGDGSLPGEAGDDAAAVRARGDRGEPGPDREPSRAPGVPDRPVGLRDDGATSEQRAPREQRVRKQPEGGGQALYEPVSEATPLDTLIPVNMASAARLSLERIRDKHGSLDAFVADRLGYEVDGDGVPVFTNGDGKVVRPFSAEQIDALASAIENVEAGAAFVLGDQTGIGKGRVVAGMLRYGMRRGLTPVLVTEKPDLYGDMYRDLRDIGTIAMLGREPKMFMTNSGESVPLNETAVEWKNEREFALSSGLKAPPKRGMFLQATRADSSIEDMRSIIDGKGTYDIVFTTYDQLNTVKGQTTPRRQFLSALAKNAMIAFDESHNAGGAAKTGWESKNAPLNRADFTRELAREAAGVIFSSATYAKRPDVMDLYARTDMGKAVDDAKNLPELIQRGGVPMQQVVATMLSDAGQYIRRERSFDGVEYALESVPVDAASYRRFSDALRAVFKFDMALKDVRPDLIQAVLDEQGAALGNDTGVGDVSATTTSFSSIMHNLISQMLLSIKADAVANMAIDAMQAGEKPVIAVANTNESFLNSFAEQEGIEIGQAMELDFGQMLKRYLMRTLRVTIKNPDKTSTHYQIPVEDLPPGLQDEYEAARALIDGSDFSQLPISPIDWIRARVKQAGATVAEVTGRGTMIDYTAERPTYVNRPRGEQGPSGKRGSIAAFNAGKLDVLILNRSGSTGVSMHASQSFADQRRRRMILAQADPNIDTHMQMLGRVHRTGQVIPPAYSQVAADIPAEARPTAVLMRKMASLNANTTGARGSAFMADSVDFMNEIGDAVVAKILSEQPELDDQLGNPLKLDDDGLPTDTDAAKHVTGRLVLLDPDQQAALLDEIQEAYRSELQQLDALGENPLEAKTLDLRAETISTTVIKERQGDGPFQDEVRIEEVSARVEGRAMSMEEVVSAVAQSIEAEVPAGDPSAAMNTLTDKRREWALDWIGTVRDDAREWITQDVATFSEKAQPKAAERHKAGLERWEATARVVYPGARIKLSLPVGEMEGVVLSVAKTGKARNPASLGSWTAKIAVPDAARTIEFPFSKLFPPSVKMSMTDKGSAVEVSRTPFRDLSEQFERARKEGRETRYIVTGNILGGYENVAGKGRIVNYTTADGQIRPGVLMGREFSLEKHMAQLAVRFESGEQVARYIESVPRSPVRSTDGNVQISKSWSGWTIELPASRAVGGRFYTDDDVRRAIAPAEFVKRGNKMVANVDRVSLVRAIDAMRGIGAKFETRENQDEAKTAIAAAPVRAEKGGPRNVMAALAVENEGDQTPDPMPRVVDHGSWVRFRNVRNVLARNLIQRVHEAGVGDQVAFEVALTDLLAENRISTAELREAASAYVGEDVGRRSRRGIEIAIRNEHGRRQKDFALAMMSGLDPQLSGSNLDPTDYVRADLKRLAERMPEGVGVMLAPMLRVALSGGGVDASLAGSQSPQSDVRNALADEIRRIIDARRSASGDGGRSELGASGRGDGPDDVRSGRDDDGRGAADEGGGRSTAGASVESNAGRVRGEPARLEITARLRDAAFRYLGDKLAPDAVAKRAAEQGYTLKGWHGTTAEFTVPDPFRKGRDFGFHFAVGRPAAANERLGFADTFGAKLALFMAKIFRQDTYYNQPNKLQAQSSIIPLAIRASNPLRLPDLVRWGDPLMWKDADQTVDMPKWLQTWVRDWFFENNAYREVDAQRFGFSQKFGRDVAVELSRRGYDSVVYKNTAEAIGTDSMFVWDAAQVRSAFDAFDERAIGEEGLRASDKYIEADMRDLFNQIMAEERIDAGQAMFSMRDAASNLDMSPQARKARAEAMGFDTSRVWYHGTNKDFAAFQIGMPGTNSSALGSWDVARSAIFLAEDPSLAEEFAGQGQRSGARVMPLYVRASNTLDVSKDGYWALPDEFFDRHGFNPRFYRNLQRWNAWEAFDDEHDGKAFVDALKADGYDSVRMMDVSQGDVENTTSLAIFDPSNIRSINATFDPRETDSPNLMASLAGVGRTAEMEGGVFDRQAARNYLGIDIGARRRLLAISLAYGPDVAMSTMTHEEIHVLRALGVLEGKTWEALSAIARKKPRRDEALRLIDMQFEAGKITADEHASMRRRAGRVTMRDIYGIDKRYRSFLSATVPQQERDAGRAEAWVEDKLLEEVVAHAAADWADGRSYGTRIDRAMMAIRDFIEAVGNFLRGNGYINVNQIFDSIWSGELVRQDRLRRQREAEASAAVQEWMRANDVTAMAVRPSQAGVMASLADAETGRSMRRDLDALGYYSQALEAARSLKQARGTPEQMLAQLKAAGVKDAEIEATNLRGFLDGKKSITRDEIVAHLEANRVGLREVIREDQFAAERAGLRNDLRSERMKFQPDYQRIAEIESRLSDIASDEEVKPKWSNYSLDPSNPTYRETVLHLPGKERRPGSERWSDDTFQSGHFSEPNIIGHMMTSMVRHEGKPVYLIDQIQSDWGQKLRDGGVRDEAKVERIKEQIRSATYDKPVTLPPGIIKEELQHAVGYLQHYANLDEMREYGNGDEKIRAQVEILDQFPREFVESAGELRRLNAELAIAERSASGHPLVNTTDQWVNTTLRRALRQASEAGAAYMAIPHGDTVLSYNPGDTDGMRGFYGSPTSEGIVPKNLRKLLEKIDKDSAKPVKVDQVKTPSKGMAGQGFTLFPLTDKVKAEVMDRGQAMFSFAGERAKTADMAALAQANEMEEAGATREAIWDVTGWFRGVDKRWRFEIDDSGSNLDLNGALADGWKPNQTWPIDHVLTHNQLLAAYPDMNARGIFYRDFPQGFDDAAGSVTKSAGSIALNSRYRDFGNDQQMRSSVLHEAQHIAQRSEDFARGGSPREFTPDELASERARLMAVPEDPNSWTIGTASGDMSDLDVGRSLYRRLAGEVEARAVQKRMDLTPDERRARPPWLDYDVPESEQIVRFANGTNLSISPVSAEPPVDGYGMRGQAMFAIRAFHGSPHDFERFDLSKIGTGEGAQAYGHGLYFAEAEAVAKEYRDGLQNYIVNGKTASPITSTPREWAAAKLAEFKGDRKAAAYTIGNTRSKYLREVRRLLEDESEVLPDALGRGRLYEVRINAEPEDFLDWDKPLSQQSEKAKQTFYGMLNPERLPSHATPELVYGHLKPAMAMNHVASARGLHPADKTEVSKALADAGIPGIKYLDQGSRSAGEGSRNYVVFDDGLIEIVAKDGQPVSSDERAAITDAMSTGGNGEMMASLSGKSTYPSLNKAITDLREALGLAHEGGSSSSAFGRLWQRLMNGRPSVNVQQGLKGLTIRQDDMTDAGVPVTRTATFKPRKNVKGQYDRTTGIISVRQSRDIKTIAHEGGHSLEGLLGGELDTLKAAHLLELMPATDFTPPPLRPDGYSGIDLDEFEQGLLVTAANRALEFKAAAQDGGVPIGERLTAAAVGAFLGGMVGAAAGTAVGNEMSGPVGGMAVGSAAATIGMAVGSTGRIAQKERTRQSGIDAAAVTAAETFAELSRAIGGKKAARVLDDVLAEDRTDVAEYVKQRFSERGEPRKRTMPVPDGPALSEAFARWFERYIMDAEGARKAAPKFFEAFEDLLDAEMPGVATAMHQVQITYRQHIQDAPVDQLANSLVSSVEKNSWSDLAGDASYENITGKLATAYNGLYDDLNPIYKSVKRLLEIADRNGVRDDNGRPISLKVAENPYKLMRLFRSSFNRGRMWLESGIADLGSTDVRGPSMRQALEVAFGGTSKDEWSKPVYKEFGAYLVARRAVAEFDRLEAKQAQLSTIDSVLDEGESRRAALSADLQGERATLDRRQTALVRAQTRLTDAKRERKSAEASVRRIEERLREKADDVLAAQMARSGDLLLRRRREMQMLERDARRLVREYETARDAVEGLEIETAMLTEEVEQRSERVSEMEAERGRLDEAMDGLRKERERTEKRGASRPPTIEDKAFHQRVIAELEAKHNGQDGRGNFKEAARLVYDWTHRLLTIRHQAGFISDDLYRELSLRKGYYVPFQRDMSDASEGDVFFRGGAKKWSPFKKFDGSDRAIINPLEALSQEAYSTAQQIAFNDTVRTLIGLAERAGPGGGTIAERVPRSETLPANETTFERIKQTAIGLGIDPIDAHFIVQRMEQNFSDADVTLMWSPVNRGPVAPPQLPLWVNGERQHIRLNDPVFGHEMFNAINGLGEEMSSLLLEWAASPARWLRTGVTTHPNFIFRNLLRDIPAAYIRAGVTPFLGHAEGLRIMRNNDVEVTGTGLQRDEFLRLYNEAGGIVGGQNVASIAQADTRTNVFDLRNSGPMTTGNQTWTGVISSKVEAIETAGRLGIAAHAYRRAIEHNPDLTAIEAMQEAAFVARDVYDWGRRGSKMLAVNRIVTFLNAALQGTESAARGVSGSGDRGVALATKRRSASLAAPMAVGVGLGSAVAGPVGGALGAMAASKVAAHLELVLRRESDGVLSQQEERDIADAYKTWFRMSSVTLFFLMLYAMMRDDPWHEDIKDGTKSTHSWVRLSTLGSVVSHRIDQGASMLGIKPAKDAAAEQIGKALGSINTEWMPDWLRRYLQVPDEWRIPKPFEWALPGNIAEMILDKMEGRDPRAAERIRESAFEVLAPPGIPQVAEIGIGLYRGYDLRRGKDIVPDNLKRLAPHQQFDAYASELAIDTSKAIYDVLGKFGVSPEKGISPKMIDWVLSNQGAYWGKDIANAWGGLKRISGFSNREESTMYDAWVVAGITGRGYRNSKSIEEFWKLHGSEGGKFAQAYNTYRAFLDQSGDPAGAAEFLSRLDPEERAYAILKQNFRGFNEKGHPLERAAAVYKINRDLRKDMILGNLTAANRRGRRDFDTRIVLSPAKQTELHDILERLSQIEVRNAMIVLGREGWKGRPYLDPKPVLDELKASSSDVYELFEAKRATARVADWEAVRDGWPKNRDELLKNGPEAVLQ